MKKLTRFFAGTMLGASLLGAFLMVSPSEASAMFKPILGCSGGTCCTFDDQTGQIYDCRPAS